MKTKPLLSTDVVVQFQVFLHVEYDGGAILASQDHSQGQPKKKKKKHSINI